MSVTAPRTRCRLLIVVVIVATFGSLVTAEFLKWDDWFNIWNNPNLNPPTWAGVAYYWKHAAYGLYIPITYTAWAALAAIGYVRDADPAGSHLNPYLFHAANLVTHVGATLVVFEILLELGFASGAACAGALIFGLHPVQVEPVAWTAGLKDVLAGVLGLVALWLYLKATKSPRPGKIYAMATITMVVAMLAKPSALVVPAMVVAIDAILLMRSWRTIIAWSGPWLMLALGCAILGAIVQPATGVTPAPLWQRPLVAADSFAFYIGKIVWPAHLGVDYGRTPARIVGSGAIEWTWLIVPIVGLILLRWRERKLIVGVVIFLIGIAPTSGIVTFLFQYYSTVADHYLYLPMLGVALLAAQIVSRIGRHAVPIAAVVLAVLAVRSGLQARYWQNQRTLFEHAIDVNPDSFMALANAADAYIEQDQIDVAERYLQRALRIKPDFLDGHVNLAVVYARQGRLVESIEQRIKALEILNQRPMELRGQVMLDNLNALVATMIDAGRIDSAGKYQALAESLAPNHSTVVEHRRRLAAAASTKPS